MTADNQRSNIRSAAQAIATVAAGNQLVIAHGNGPQVGLLALQAAAYHDVAPYPLDEIGPIRTLVDDETVVICAGGWDPDDVRPERHIAGRRGCHRLGSRRRTAG